VDFKDKIIESRDAAHAELQQREEQQRNHDKDRLPSPVVESLHEASRERRAQLLGAIRMILGRERLEVGQLRMPPRETQALQALQAAVEGKSTDLQQFVYASDRRDLLERALGVLQPDLTRTDDKTARELHAQLADLSQRLGALRHRLSSLEDAQDEILHGQGAAAEIVAAPGDKPEPRPPSRPSDPDAPRPATTLTGPDLPELSDPKPAPTTLTGPDLPQGKPAPSTLAGPELPQEKPAPSTLAGPELPQEKPAPSTLIGPDLPDAPPAPSTLGIADAAAGDAAAGDGPAGAPQKPWWRRPFG
jgi:hypothetical protein